jgi:hypothetical protein
LYSNRRPATRRGRPAFGCALTGSAVCGTSASTIAAAPCGPSVQLVPSITIGRPLSTVATSRGLSPPSVRPSLANVAWAMTGRPVTPAATRTASASSSR